MRYSSYFLFFLVFLVIGCKSDSQDRKKLGKVDLEVTGNEQAQLFFDQGLAYLHSFEYLDARNQFIKAQQADPQCGMAYWGELMAYNHPLFNRELGRFAQLTFKKMGSNEQERAALFKTDMERDLLTSVEILYGHGTRQQRNNAYREHYKILAKKYPNNHEIQAFYALSLLGAPIDDQKDSGTETAASLMRDLLDQNPDHPGALHYYIHAYDDPLKAHLAIEAADRYAKVAPDATHALHMPSHIYLSLGKWNDVINSNIDSWNANVNARKLNPSKEAGYHSLNWLQYGLLQRDETELATRLMNDMIEYVKKDQTILARSYFIAMKGIHMVATDTWSGAIADAEIKMDDLHLTKQAGFLYLDGMKAAYRNDPKTLKSLIEVIARKKYIASLNLGENVAVMCNTAGNPSIPPNQIDIDLVSIMELELEAQLALMSGRNNEALELLSKGAKIYEDLSISFGPPVVFKPIHTMYAEVLISQKQYKKALEVLDRGLHLAPRKLDLLKLKEIAASNLNKAKILANTKKEIETSLAAKSHKEVLTAQ